MVNIAEKIIIFLTKMHIQILLGVFFATLAYFKIGLPNDLNITIEFREMAILLASIASIIALITSLTYAFVMNNMYSSTNRIESLVLEFKNFLFKLDIFLDSLPQDISAVQEARALSFDLKFIENKDIPLNDWDDKLQPLIEAINETNEYTNEPNLGRRIMEHYGYLEYLLSEIGVLRIRQIITGIFIKTLFKGFILLVLIILSVLCLFVLQQSLSLSVMLAVPIFFGTLVSLLILEIAWWIKREEKEMMTFIEEDTHEKVEKNN